MNLNQNDSHLEIDPWRRLAAAIIVQAIKDAKSKRTINNKIKDEAIAFLKKSDLIVMLGLDRNYLLNKIYSNSKKK